MREILNKHVHKFARTCKNNEMHTSHVNTASHFVFNMLSFENKYQNVGLLKPTVIEWFHSS